MSHEFSESVKNAKSALESWVTVIGFLQGAEGANGEKFNQEAAVPGTGQQLWWFDERVIAVSNLIKSLEKVEIDTGAPIPLSYIKELEVTSQSFKDEILRALGAVEIVDGKEIGDLNPSNWVITVDGNTSLNFASHLQNIKVQVETVLKQYYRVSNIVGASEFDAFTEAVREFSEKAETTRKDASVVLKAKKKIEKDSISISQKKERVTDNQVVIEELLEKSRQSHGQIEETNQLSQSTLGEVSQIANEAATLKSVVEGYNHQFQEFQQSLNEKEETFQTWTEDVEGLRKVLKEKSDKIERMLDRAEEMLKGATNAGLASTFSHTLKDLETKLDSARSAFNASIVFLLVSAIPLAIYMLYLTVTYSGFEVSSINGNIEVGKLAGKTGISFNGNGFSFTTTLALFLLMVPSIWMTKFSASRHHQLFQLREHYQYKYTLAMAVDGFKKQSPDHADAIAAETFNRLLFNPADRLDGHEKTTEHPSPLMNWLMNKFGFNAEGRQQ